MTEKNKARLETAQSILKYALAQNSYREWYAQAVHNIGFYEGTGHRQFLPSDVQTMAERGQEPITFNMIQGQIKTISGIEIKSRQSIGVQIDLADQDGADEEQKYSTVSKALTHFLLHTEKSQNMDYILSECYRDAMVCGLGFVSAFKENNIIRCEHVNILNVVPDFDDKSFQFSNMSFICHAWYLKRDEIISLWPHTKEILDESGMSHLEMYSKSEEVDNLNPPSIQSNVSSTRPRVWEVQYKEARKAYTGVSKTGRYFQTFDYEQAEEIAGEGGIEEIDSSQIIRTLFMDDILLETAPLDPSYPGQTDFSFVPLVWNKEKITNKPYGLIDANLKGLQMGINAMLNNALYYMYARQYVLKGETLNGMTPGQIKRELNDRNGLLHVLPDSDIQMLGSKDDATISSSMIEDMHKMIQRATGVNDELQGVQTNATSAIAQRVRQVNSVTNNVMGFDALSLMRERIARVMIDIFQNSFYENYYIEVLDGEEKEAILLNAVYEDTKGNKKIMNDVNFLPVSLYFEETDHYSSSKEEKRANAIAISQNLQLLSMPTLLKDMGMRHAEQYIKEFEEKQMEQMAIQQGQPANGGQEQMIQPDSPLKPI